MKVRSLLALSAIYGAALLANEPPPTPSDWTAEASLSQGYRRDRLSWSTRGHHGHPNVLSELRYKHLNIWQTRLMGKLAYNGYFARVELAYGDLTHGRWKDSDYARDNRRCEFFRSRGHLHGCNTKDAQIAIGKDFHPTPTTTVTPLIGYTVDMQKLHMHHGHQELAPDFSNGKVRHVHRRIHHLHSTYRARWQAPLIGVRANQTFCSQWGVLAEYDFLYPLRYHGHTHWNLRNKRTHQHNKSGRSFGHMITAGISRDFWERCSLLAEYELMLFYARKGHVEGHMKGGDHYRIPFRKANLTSSEIRLTFLVRF